MLGVLKCPAKVNLSLAVVGKRPDGYHELVSVAAPISLADELFIRPAPAFSLTLTGPFAPALSHEPPETNLLHRAFHQHASAWRVPPLALRLIKNIPPGGGLGGGSSDTAALLGAMARLAARPPTPRQLHRAALALGADVPFFLSGGAALMQGIGEKLTPVQVARAHQLTVVFPGAGMSTAKAYAALGAGPVTPQARRRAVSATTPLVQALAAGQLPPNLLFNDFENVTPRPAPLGEGWRLSGSGACWFCPGWPELGKLPEAWCVWRCRIFSSPVLGMGEGGA